MKITCISDLHGYYPQLPGGDLLIVAGDYTARDMLYEWGAFFEWLKQQPYTKKILVAGNHDGFLYKAFHKTEFELEEWDEIQEFRCMFPTGDDFEYLCDSGCELTTDKSQLKVWGSPWVPQFYDWYFMLDRGKPIKEKWDLIPDDIDILITHGPAWGCLDTISGKNFGKFNSSLGCQDLTNVVARVQPKLHVFGHIHGSYGVTKLQHVDKQTVCVNAAIMNEDYIPVNKPITIDL